MDWFSGYNTSANSVTLCWLKLSFKLNEKMANSKKAKKTSTLGLYCGISYYIFEFFSVFCLRSVCNRIEYVVYTLHFHYLFRFVSNSFRSGFGILLACVLLAIFNVLFSLSFQAYNRIESSIFEIIFITRFQIVEFRMHTQASRSST